MQGMFQKSAFGFVDACACALGGAFVLNASMDGLEVVGVINSKSDVENSHFEMLGWVKNSKALLKNIQLILFLTCKKKNKTHPIFDGLWNYRHKYPRTPSFYIPGHLSWLISVPPRNVMNNLKLEQNQLANFRQTFGFFILTAAKGQIIVSNEYFPTEGLIQN